MLKAVAHNMDDFSDLTMLRWPGVRGVSSTFVMEGIKASSVLPL